MSRRRVKGAVGLTQRVAMAYSQVFASEEH